MTKGVSIWKIPKIGPKETALLSLSLLCSACVSTGESQVIYVPSDAGDDAVVVHTGLAHDGSEELERFDRFQSELNHLFALQDAIVFDTGDPRIDPLQQPVALEFLSLATSLAPEDYLAFCSAVSEPGRTNPASSHALCTARDTAIVETVLRYQLLADQCVDGRLWEHSILEDIFDATACVKQSDIDLEQLRLDDAARGQIWTSFAAIRDIGECGPRLRDSCAVSDGHLRAMGSTIIDTETSSVLGLFRLKVQTTGTRRGLRLSDLNLAQIWMHRQCRISRGGYNRELELNHADAAMCRILRHRLTV